MDSAVSCSTMFFQVYSPPDAESVIIVDPDENKYERRPLNERISRVVKNTLEERQKRNKTFSYESDNGDLRTVAIVLLLIILGAVTILELYTRAKTKRVVSELEHP
eukprot:m.174598 g.174598  ORF g.174598 m.174598 type:complete len:106 (+) comp18329_c0_seq13:241-558(+)